MNRTYVQTLLAFLSLLICALVLIGLTGDVDALKALAFAGLLLSVAVLV